MGLVCDKFAHIVFFTQFKESLDSIFATASTISKGDSNTDNNNSNSNNSANNNTVTETKSETKGELTADGTSHLIY